MADIAKMIEERRGKTSYDDLAREINIKTPTLFRYIKEQRNISVPNIRKIACWARTKGDEELVYALASYAVGFDLKLSG